MVKIEKILVVDDEQLIYSYLERKFNKLEYTVFVAKDGQEALDQAFANLPDIILLDVKLPKLNGIEVCKILKSDERTKNIPILMLSAKAQSEEINAGLAAGANRYLKKPIGFPDILREVQSFDNEL